MENNNLINPTGKTTRLADKYIQDLYTFKKIKIEDHHPTFEASKRLFRIIIDRLTLEHDLKELIKSKKVEINTRTLTISFI